ncbi:hypothetical protein V8C42DRAFT_307545 [Trichoderma barbatum]
MQILLNHLLCRPRHLLPPRPQHHVRNPPNESVGRLGHGRILLSIPLDLWLTDTPVLLGNRVQHTRDVATATPPGGLVASAARGLSTHDGKYFLLLLQLRDYVMQMKKCVYGFIDAITLSFRDQVS